MAEIAELPPVESNQPEEEQIAETDESQPAFETEDAGNVDAVDEAKAEPDEEREKLLEKISNIVEESKLPEDADFLLAKNYLTSKVGVKHPISLYDHITTLIMKSMQSRNSNAVDDFERLSLAVKKSSLTVDQSKLMTSLNVNETSVHKVSAQKRLELLKPAFGESAETDLGDIPDMMDLASLWEWAGINFGKEDSYLLFLSIKRLIEVKQLKSVRLWGKLFGLEANYIVAEGELKEGAEDIEESIANPPEANYAPIETEAPSSDEVEVKPTNPGPQGVAKPKQYSPLPKENRIGANKYIYYVCSSVGGAWTRLPDVIPERLQEARHIRKYLTGHLNATVDSYPPFKGKEAQYLRCQIARISAATVISPKGYYMVDGDGEDSEDGGSPSVIINPEFEGISNDQLSNLGNWVHHAPYILPQGRVVYEAPKLIKEQRLGEEDEGDDEQEEESTAEPERGPQTLSSISADQDHGNTAAWSARVCSRHSPIKFSPVALRSNVWPGAYSLSYNDKFANIYIGDGLKDLGNPEQNYAPQQLPNFEVEYAVPENSENPDLLVEQIDPTVEEENAFLETKKSADDEEDGQEAGEEGEEKLEDDDE